MIPYRRRAKREKNDTAARNTAVAEVPFGTDDI